MFEGSAIVIPQTLSEGSICITLNNGGVFTKKLGNPDFVLTGGNEYTYNLTVNLTSLEMTAVITPWKSVASDSTTIILP